MNSGSCIYPAERARHGAAVTSVQGGTRLIQANRTASHDLGTVPVSGLRRTLRGTPRRIHLMTAGLVVVVLALGFVYTMALSRDSSSLRNVASRTAEVSATSDLYYQLNDMDAQAANALLVGFHPSDPSIVPASVNAAASDKAYETDRSAADADLERIAANPSLAKQAGNLLDAFGSYQAEVAEALYVDQNTPDERPAAPPATALSLYTGASSLLHSTLLSEASAITSADDGEVNASYAADHSTMTAFGYALLGLGLFAASMLVLGNLFYAKRFRRRLSFLALGTVIALVLGVLGLTTQAGAADRLHVAKQSAYDSIYALDRALAVSDDANGDESRWLLEGRPAALQTSYFQKVSEVVRIPSVSVAQAAADPSAYYQALDSAIGAVRLDAAANSVGGVTFSGYLGTESGNITFPKEGLAAVTATQDFEAYLRDDQKMRADAASGDVTGAVALDIGLQAGQSNYDFGRYMDALRSVVGINTAQFDSAVAQGESATGTAAWVEAVAGDVLLLLLIVQAAYLRLREYR